jgi:Flp pilus assembly protein TadG
MRFSLMQPILVTLLRGEQGSVMIETALSYMAVMTCILGIVECCMMTYTYSVYGDAARMGVRYAIFHGTDSSNCSGPSTGCTDSTGANVTTYVENYAANYKTFITGMTVTPTYPDNSSAPPSRVAVTINYTYKPLFNFPGTSVTFQVSSQGRILY